MAYGVVPTLQPLEDFGRTYAVYGGVFIVFSYAFARIVDGFKLDVGDYVGYCGEFSRGSYRRGVAEGGGGLS